MNTDPSPFLFPRNLVLAASAGTGKTYALTGIAVHLFLGASELGGAGLRAPLSPARLVATTFSRKAAREIRERIGAALSSIASPEATAPPYLDTVRAAYALHKKHLGESELRTLARRALAQFSQARIGTIHSFATSLVQEHVLVLGLPAEATLLSEEDARDHARRIITEVLLAFGSEHGHTVREFVRTAGGFDNLVGNILGLLDELSETGEQIDERADSTVDRERVDDIRSLLETDARSFLEGRHAEASQRVLEALRPGAHDLAGLVGDYFDKVLRRSSDPRHARLRELTRGETLREQGEQLGALLTRAPDFAQLTEQGGRLVAACANAIWSDRMREGAFTFSDMLVLARNLLRDHPDVAAEVSSRFDALLVDEAQDTSPLQRELLSLVWERSPEKRAPGVSPPPGHLRPHGLLVVGDRKQSIYGFRGADVAGFTALCLELAGESAARGWGVEAPTDVARSTIGLPAPAARGDFRPLVHNRRSGPRILDFVNAFCRVHLTGGGDAFDFSYQPETEDLRVPPESELCCALPPATTWLRPEITNTASGRQKFSTSPLDDARAIAQTIRSLTRPGDCNGSPGVHFRDVGVLAYSNDMLDTIAFALAEEDVPFVVAGHGFYSSLEVADLVAFLQILGKPTDRLAWLEVLRGPFAGVEDATLFTLVERGRGLLLPYELDGHELELPATDRERVRRLLRVFFDLRRLLGHTTVGDLLRIALNELEVLPVLRAMTRGAQRVANVEKLVSLSDFELEPLALARRIRERSGEMKSESEAPLFSAQDDAVRLLTIHSSKGLDFEVVFVAGIGSVAPSPPGPRVFSLFREAGSVRLTVRTTDGRGRSVRPPSFEESMRAIKGKREAERKRLTYVAVTRARRQLILVGDRRRPNQTSASYLASPVAALHELLRHESHATFLESSPVEASSLGR